MDTGRRYKTHGSETKDSLLPTAFTVAQVAGFSSHFLGLSCQKLTQRDPENTCICGEL